MRRFLIFTLLSLLATTAVFIDDLNAGSDWKFDTLLGNIYGETNAWAWFDSQSLTAYTNHATYISNRNDGAAKMYSSGSIYVSWNGGDFSDKDEDHAWVPADDYDHIYHNFSFHLGGKEAGPGYVSATTELSLRYLPTNEKVWYPTASTSAHFELQ